MTYSFDQAIDPSGSFEHVDMHIHSSRSEGGAASSFHILRAKLEVPPLEDHVPRPRIDNLLRRSIEQFPATLISGRAGTGKTAIAAAFAAGNPRASWFSVESTDSEWTIFSKYLTDLISGGRSACPTNFDEEEVAQYLINSLTSNDVDTAGQRLLIMDDIHHIFDADWFDDFFKLFLYSLPADTHLIMLCRSKPPSPLWRFRSKQILNVIDEKIIAFSPREAAEFFAAKGLPSKASVDTHRRCYGRISKMKEIARYINS